MLIPQGEVVYQNLYTAFTNVDQLIAELETHQSTGFCLMSSPGYEGAVLFDSNAILSGIESLEGTPPVIHTGEPAVEGFLSKARDKTQRKISVHKLSEDTVKRLAAALNAVPIHENLSTDFTSLDKLLALQEKNRLSGYVEVFFEGTSGVANIFFLVGKMVQSIFAPSSSGLLAASISFDELIAICRTNRAIFNVYQSKEGLADAERIRDLDGPAPQQTITLLGQILIVLETVIDHAAKEGAFAKTLHAALPQLANQYEFFDPFVGEFKYAKRTLTFESDITLQELLDGMCALVNTLLPQFYTVIPQNTLLPKISRAMEPVSLAYADLIDQLRLKTCMSEIFQDYSYLKEIGLDADEQPDKLTQKQLILNLRGVESPETGSEEILEKYYKAVELLHERYTDQEGKYVYYTKLKSSQEYKDYQAATALLQKFDLATLQDRNQRLAFWLNMYNFLAIDGVLGLGVTKDVRQTKGFFSKTCYLIGKHIFSLDDIEHGILRNNHRHPYTLFGQFNNTDTRKAFCIDPLESRIHCCLVCAAKSSPPLVIYKPEILDEQLDVTTDYFLTTQGMKIELDQKELWLDRTFYWYRKDFKQQGLSLTDFMINAVRNEETRQMIQKNRSVLKLRFMEYDWSLNGE